MSAPTNSIAFELAENVIFTQDFQQFIVQLTELYSKMAKASNSKDIGSYETIEQLNGQRYFGADPQHKRGIYRKVIETGALLNAAPTAVNHGLNGGAAVPNTWRHVRTYGWAIDAATPLWIPLPNGGIHDCSLQVTATQVIITPTVNLAAFTESCVVLEYYKS
jgi:hypothetical protein